MFASFLQQVNKLYIPNNILLNFYLNVTHASLIAIPVVLYIFLPMLLNININITPQPLN